MFHHEKQARWWLSGLALAVLVGVFLVGLVATAHADSPRRKGERAHKRARMGFVNAPGMLIAPVARVGDVRRLMGKAMSRSIKAMMGFSAGVRVLTDKSRPVAKTSKIREKRSVSERRIHNADAVRQKAMGLASRNYHSRAFELLSPTIAVYESTYPALVDFSKLADAYARAAVSGWYAHKGAPLVELLLRKALTLHPTLVIDKRSADTKLIALFEQVASQTQRRAHLTLMVKGALEDGEVFIDGVRMGPLPAGRGQLAPGTHYVQVRQRGKVVQAHRVRLEATNVTLDVRKPNTRVAQKTPPKTAETKTWKMRDVAACGFGGRVRHRECKRRIKAIATQTGAVVMLFPSLRADKAGRLTLETFLVDPSNGKVTHQPAVAVAADLGNVHQQLATVERNVVVDARRMVGR